MDEPTHLLQSIEGRVFEVTLSSAEELAALQKQFRISNISNDSRGLCARLVSEHPPKGYSHQIVHPNLEDLYLYHFD